MRRSIAFWLAALLVVVCLCGCSAPKGVVAQVGDTDITQEMFDQRWTIVKTQYGITEEIETNEDYAEFIENSKVSTLEKMIEEEIMMQKAMAGGYCEYTEDDLATLDEELAQMKVDWREAAETAVESAGITPGSDTFEETVQSTLDTMVEQLGYDDEYLLSELKKSMAYERLYDASVSDITPSDDEVQAYYEEKIAEHEKTYGQAEDIDIYPNAVVNGEEVYYTPAGYNMVRQILLRLDDDAQAQIAALRAEEKAEEADALLEESLKPLTATAEKIVEEFENGTDFETLVDQYNMDGGQTKDTLYPVKEGTRIFVAPFAEAAAALTQPGTISPIVASDYGYHIIYLVEISEEGPVDFEEYKDVLRDDLTYEMQTEKWNQLLETWHDELGVKMYM